MNGSIRRINRDTRFSADKRPYKDHLDFLFLYAGAGNKDGAAHFLRITPRNVIIGAGVYKWMGPQLTAYREAVGEDASGKPIDAIVKKLRRAGYEVGGEHYKRVPRGFDADHPRADLLRYAGLHAYIDGPAPDEMHSRKFVTWAAKHFAKLAPLPEWICEHVPGGKK